MMAFYSFVSFLLFGGMGIGWVGGGGGEGYEVEVGLVLAYRGIVIES